MILRLSRGLCATVDAADYGIVGGHKWSASGHNPPYAFRNIQRAGEHSVLYLHHAILGAPPAGLRIDHKDGNRLNCSRENLRFVSASKNGENRAKLPTNNSTGCLGVSPRRGKFRATLSRRHLGTFSTVEEACARRREEELSERGELAAVHGL